MRGSLVGCCCLVLLGIASGAYAHHSAAGIDRSKSVTIVGTLKQFKWTNPHSWMEIDVPNDHGGVDTWGLEMTAPSILVRAGWKSTIVKAGDKVTAVVRPFKNGDPGGLFVSITLPSGQTLTERSLTAPAPPTP